MTNWSAEAKQTWNITHHDENEYNKRKEQMTEQGILCKLQFNESNDKDPFYSLLVIFAPEFKHLIKPSAVTAKTTTNSNFHISLGYKTSFNDNTGMLRALQGIQQKYEHPTLTLIKHIHIANSSVINILPTDPLYRELNPLVYHGTYRHPHISMD